MAQFKDIKTAIQQQFTQMAEGRELFRVDLTRDFMWVLYLASFPPGTNPIYKERTEHDCFCCRQFIKDMGNVVSIVEDQMVSIWDVDVPEPYQTVADAMAKEVKDRFITDVFRYREAYVGTDFNRTMENMSSEGIDVITYHHFYLEIPLRFVSKDFESALNSYRTSKEVFKRGLEEITLESVDIVFELIAQNSLYRGEEHRAVVELFRKHKRNFDILSGLEVKDIYCWKQSVALGVAARIRNTVIGTLLTDLSDGVELTRAVKSFEDKVAPGNYKRPTALITKGMIKKAQEKVEKLGLTASLTRRHAVTKDITINNVLFADREAKKQMNAFDELATTTPEKGKFDKVETVGIKDFLSDILPNVDKVELFLDNKHTGNLMSLIAPVNSDSKHLFKWDNNFSWAYNGEVTDSIKERVKSAGGNVNGILRFSLQWNEENKDQKIDFDAHCIEPDGNKIYYPSAGRPHASSGVLDVDNIYPGNKIAVENITHTNKAKIEEGVYTYLIHNYSRSKSTAGFTAEFEYDGVIHTFQYPKALFGDQKVSVLKVNYSKTEDIRIIESLPSTQVSKTVWSMLTQTFRKVSMIMASPNHWDDRVQGNKHWFFILDGCKNDTLARGFFNEYISETLREHRKVFEVLGSRMRVPESDEQLSGLGFSSTQRNNVLCRVSGSFNRVVKIMF